MDAQPLSDEDSTRRYWETRKTIEESVRAANLTTINYRPSDDPDARKEALDDLWGHWDRLQLLGGVSFAVGGYHAVEINDATRAVQALIAEIEPTVDHHARPELSDDAAALPQSGAPSPDTSVEL
jgi:hypothetical protein